VNRSRYIAQAGVIAAGYAALTFLALQIPGGLGWGLVQLRLSEAVTVLPILTRAAVPGLWLGAVAANLTLVSQVGPIALLDVVFGSLGTLLGALWTRRFRENVPLALLGPVIANALIVPAYLPIVLKGAGLYKVPLLGVDLEGQWLAAYLFGVVSVAIGQAVVVYGLGWPLLVALRRSGIARYLDDTGMNRGGDEREGDRHAGA